MVTKAVSCRNFLQAACAWLNSHVHKCLRACVLPAGVSGRVSVNGQPLTAVTMQRLCGYVLQDDVLPGTSTVAEYLRQVSS